MDATLLQKARAIMRTAVSMPKNADMCAEIPKGTLDDVLRIFPGARVLNGKEASAQRIANDHRKDSRPRIPQRQLRLVSRN
jgi:hypothetical protein